MLIFYYRSVPNLFAILRERELPEFPLASHVKFVINALLSLDLSPCLDSIFPVSKTAQNVERLIEILDKATQEQYTKLDVKEETSFDENGSPLISLLRKIREIAPDEVKSYMKTMLLPSEE